MDGLLTVDQAFNFAGVTTRAALEARLLNLRARGRTIDALPGRILEKLPEILSAARPDYDYAEAAFFLGAHAADNILNATVDWPDKLMETVLHHKMQFIGMMREHCQFGLRQFMFMSGLDAIPNCTGLSPAGYGDATVPPYCAESNANAVRKVLRSSGVLCQRTLALIKPEDTPDRRVSRHELRYWIEGADLPEAQLVPVEVCWRNGRLDIGPAGEDKLRLVQMGWDMPVFTVPKNAVVPIPGQPSLTAKGPEWPIAAEGPRYAVAKDFHAFYDKRDGRELPIETDNARLAVRMFLKHAHGCRNAVAADDILKLLEAERTNARMRPAGTLEIIHYFQRKVRGERVTLAVYPALIHNAKGQGFYWIEL